MFNVFFRRVSMAAVVAAVWAGPLFAGPPLAEKIPADAIVYVGWKGTDNAAGYAGSNLEGIVKAVDLPALVRKMSEARRERVATSQPSDNQRVMGEQFQAIFTIAFHHPSAVYFGGMDFTTPDKPIPHIALMIEAGSDAAALLDHAKELLAAHAALVKTADFSSSPSLAAIRKGDLVIITIGSTPRLDPLLTDAAPTVVPLSGTDDFKAALAQGDADPVAIVYIDAPAALRTVDAGVAAKNAPDSLPAQNWPKARDLLNLGALSQMIYTGRFEGKDFIEHCFVAMPADKAKRFGVLSLLDFPALSDAAMNAIPAGAAWGGAFHFDGKRILAEARDAANKLGETQGRQFDGALQMGAGYIGLDVEKDLFPNLSNEWTFFAVRDTTGAATGQTLRGLTLVNHVTNHEKAHAALDNLETFINDSIADRSPNPANAPQFNVTTSSGLAVHTINMPRTSPSWALDGKDYFYLGLSPQGVQVASDHIKNGTPSIFTSQPFAGVFKSINVAHPNSVNFSDLTETGPVVYNNYLRRIAAEAKAHPENAAVSLPPVEKILPYLGLFLSVSALDETGFHTTTVGPFPGAMVLSGTQALMSSLQPEGARARRPRVPVATQPGQ